MRTHVFIFHCFFTFDSRFSLLWMQSNFCVLLWMLQLCFSHNSQYWSLLCKLREMKKAKYIRNTDSRSWKKFTFLFQQFCQTRIIVMTNKHVQLNWTFVSLAHFASKFCQVNIRRSILKPTWHSHVISPNMARYSKSFWWFHLEIEINVQNFHLDLKRIKPNIAA